MYTNNAAATYEFSDLRYFNEREIPHSMCVVMFLGAIEYASGAALNLAGGDYGAAAAGVITFLFIAWAVTKVIQDHFGAWDAGIVDVGDLPVFLTYLVIAIYGMVNMGAEKGDVLLLLAIVGFLLPWLGLVVEESWRAWRAQRRQQQEAYLAREFRTAFPNFDGVCVSQETSVAIMEWRFRHGLEEDWLPPSQRS